VKDIRRLTFLLALAFTLALVPAVSAQPNKPLRCGMSWDIDYDIVPVGWRGTVWGDINGDLTATLVDARWTPHDKTEHWIETWVIVTGTGEIYGEEEGVEMTDPGPPPDIHLELTMFILPSTGKPW